MTLRKIIVEENVYLYKSVTGFGGGTEIATFEITIFLENHKQTPLKINFITWEDLYAGNPLKTGVKLTRLSTQETEFVNLNRPKYIRECILYSIKMGWNGQNKVESIDGLKILMSLGFDVSCLHPKEGFIIAHGKEYLK
ncbi:hypothetical protein [Flavobacterium sp. ov086]|uniref:hypothetical protein n=1 Tax=Flavobacterium sp. ov086 TaxID=1761785 RepID=UPI000B6A56AC|nr:hypothetical protein [Flavobacterium sp. ov086]SNR51845.1 hypothetical protein SAMN04487979_10967 [Flavobacterium sp. ov086]